MSKALIVAAGMVDVLTVDTYDLIVCADGGKLAPMLLFHHPP